MRFSLVQSELHRCLQLVASVVPTRAANPNLGSVLVEATKDGSITFQATDLDTFLLATARGVVDEPGVAAIPARRFLEVVKELPSDAVQAKGTGGGLTLTCGQGRYRLVGPDPDEFPEVPSLSEEKIFAAPVEVLERLIRQTAYAVSTDNTRPEMTGVYVHVVEGALRFVATDGHRLARAEARGDYSTWGDIIIPPKSLAIVQRLLGEAQESVSLSTNRRYCLFNFGASRLYTRLLDGRFPNYPDVIARCQPDKRAFVRRDDFLGVLRRVAVFSESMTRQVKLSLSEGALRVSVATQSVGEAEDVVPLRYDGPPFHIGYNANFLLELLRTTDAEELELAFQEPTSAGLITPVVTDGQPDLLCLVMPLRLPGEEIVAAAGEAPAHR